MRSSLTILLILIIYTSYSSNFRIENDSIIRFYKIELDSRPQTIELFELSNNKFVGFITTNLDKGMYPSSWIGRTWTNLWNRKNIDITDKEEISALSVKQIMSELYDNKIEDIKDCELSEDCSKHSSFLDSGGILFHIKTPVVEKKLYYEEISLIKNEKNDIRLHIQKLFIITQDRLNLENKFSLLFERLPSCWYSYYKASGNARVYIKNTK
jgi:hypothetical protein